MKFYMIKYTDRGESMSHQFVASSARDAKIFAMGFKAAVDERNTSHVTAFVLERTDSGEDIPMSLFVEPEDGARWIARVRLLEARMDKMLAVMGGKWDDK